jgi:ferredoxin
MKIILDKVKCIGCGSCVALCPKFFEMDEENKAHLKNSELDNKTNKETLEVSKPECAEETLDVCPVECIKIYDSN